MTWPWNPCFSGLVKHGETVNAPKISVPTTWIEFEHIHHIRTNILDANNWVFLKLDLKWGILQQN